MGTPIRWRQDGIKSIFHIKPNYCLQKWRNMLSLSRAYLIFFRNSIILRLKLTVDYRKVFSPGFSALGWKISRKLHKLVNVYHFFPELTKHYLPVYHVHIWQMSPQPCKLYKKRSFGDPQSWVYKNETKALTTEKNPDNVSNHQPHQCLLNRLFGHRSKKTSKPRVTGPLWGEFTGDRWIPHTKG